MRALLLAVAACAVSAACAAPPALAVQDQPSGTAAQVLATLPVKGKAPMTGYSRDRFGQAWTDDVDVSGGHNGCDTRDDVLARDLDDELRSGCKVLTGTLVDPYTGRTIVFHRGPRTSSAVQIDHRVALGNAWTAGAAGWSETRRVQLANDPANLQATDGPTNQAKGDRDGSGWLPPNKAYRCAYVAAQVGVKSGYGLSVTPAERDAIARVLASCPGEPLPR